MFGIQRLLRLVAIASVLSLLAVTPAAAQFEVAPDHFDGQPVNPPKNVAASQQENQLQARIAETQTLLAGYAASLEKKSQAVEEAREDAISAGIQGDGAGPYIAVLRQQEGELEQMRQSLAPLVSRTEQTLTSLQNELSEAVADRVVSQSRAPVRPQAVPRRHSLTLQASARLPR